MDKKEIISEAMSEMGKRSYKAQLKKKGKKKMKSHFSELGKRSRAKAKAKKEEKLKKMAPSNGFIRTLDDFFTGN